MGQNTLIGGTTGTPSLHDGPMGAWLPDPHDDQHLAGGILWGSGDLIGAGVLRGAVRPVGALLDEGGGPRGPAAGPARGARSSRAAGARATSPDDRRDGSIAAVNDSTSTRTAPLRVLVYSDDVNTRQQVILALGRRPHPDLPEVEYVEVATEPVVHPEHGRRAASTSRSSTARPSPPAAWASPSSSRTRSTSARRCVVLTGRPQDAWLATWSRAEAAVPHPLDPIQLAETVVTLLRSRVPATT